MCQNPRAKPLRSLWKIVVKVGWAREVGGLWMVGSGDLGGRDQVNQSVCLFQLLEVACVPWLVASPIYTARVQEHLQAFFSLISPLVPHCL